MEKKRSKSVLEQRPHTWRQGQAGPSVSAGEGEQVGRATCLSEVQPFSLDREPWGWGAKDFSRPLVLGMQPLPYPKVPGGSW